MPLRARSKLERMVTPLGKELVGCDGAGARTGRVAVRIMVRVPRRVVEELTQFHLIGSREPRQPPPDLIVERELAVLLQAKQRLRGKGLGQRGELVARGDRRWQCRREMGLSIAFHVRHSAVEHDGDGSRRRFVMYKAALHGRVHLAGPRWGSNLLTVRKRSYPNYYHSNQRPVAHQKHLTHNRLTRN